MLFNSQEFLLYFLPLTLLGFYLIAHYISKQWAKAFLVSASLFFYGWWNTAYLFLLVSSLFFNFTIGQLIIKKETSCGKIICIVGVSVNLLTIGYFKYANFFVDGINSAFDVSFNLEQIILPLAISFFTFQQIAFLVDSFNGHVKEVNFVDYALFVTFFPQLIAGPIVHHKEMMPQFNDRQDFSIKLEYLVTGMTIFMIGLFKKTVIADSISNYVWTVFSQDHMTFFGAWIGALTYSFQLYFDFSGYSDMAFGLAKMFGIRLPINFFSPYKSSDIITFWRNWHMTLSRFLRDYIYIPMGGNRLGLSRRYFNLILTMLLGGLWHGAGWNFIFWGLLHGLYLIINHAWRKLTNYWRDESWQPKWWYTFFSTMFTFIFVTFAWVFFRSENLDSAIMMAKVMCGLDGIIIHPVIIDLFPFLDGILKVPSGTEQWLGGLNPRIVVPQIIFLMALVLILPNSYQYMRITVSLEGRNFPLLLPIYFSPNRRHAFLIAFITILAFSFVNSQSEFLYFQF